MPFISTALFRYVRTVFLMMLIGFVTVPAASAAVSDAKDRSVIGKWILAATLDFADIASLDEIEAGRLVGRIVTISNEKLTFGELECTSPNFESERVEPGLYLRDRYHADVSELGLPNPVTVVHLDCTSVFLKDRNRLVFFWKGWFFDAKRVQGR